MNSQSTTGSPTQRNLRERIADSRFLTYSLLIHAILIPILATMLIVAHHQQPDDIPSGQLGDASGIDVPQPDQPIDQPSTPVDTATPATVMPPPNSSLSILTADNPRPAFSVPSAQMRIQMDLPTLTTDSGPSTVIPKKLPGTYKGRFAKDGMGRIIGNPGSPAPRKATEDSVLRALRWLRQHQNRDGSWGEQNKGAMTGLALLCFLGHGELIDSKEFGFAVNHGIEWLIVTGQKSEGRLSMTGADWGPGNGGVYEHGIATYALSEYYTLTRAFTNADERVVELLKQAVGHIVRGQGPDGGWMYHFDKSTGDTSVSGWQIQALKAAHLTGLNLPGVTEALDKSMANLARVRGAKGGYGYRNAEDRYSLTGVGVLCELFWKGERNSELRRSIEFISDTVRRDQPVKYQHEKADLYAWYYHTQAMLMFGGDAWTVWDRRFSDEIMGAQSPDGSWPKMQAAAHGNLQTSETLTGAIYRTTFCTLMLESYYRYSPTLRADSTPARPDIAAR